MNRSEKFRNAAARHNGHRSPRGRRYPEKLRTLAVEHCQDSRLAGQSYSKIAEDLGVNPLTLSRWLDQHDARRRALRPVVIKGSAYEGTDGTLAVVSPCGLRVEGVKWPQALELLRVLS